MQFNRSDIDVMSPRFRAQFINSLSGYKSANLVATRSRDGKENVAIVSSVFHLGANPPLMGVIFRPHSAPRHSLENLLDTGEFTLNQVNMEIYRCAHQTSARFEREQSEFVEVGLTAEYEEGVFAPFVQQSRVKMGLKVVDHQIMCNKTELVVGEIFMVLAPAQSVVDDGYIDIAGLGAVAVSGLDSYHVGRPLERLAYAKPNQPVRPLVCETAQSE
ncbi:flavin reductase [Gilvimarinus sp. SDUM040013]|uniref:Flavin reductase n=1 Tax=Gilvimarinus gilvus TaxID=3058038 RepID=A0ABU4RXH1_9GAMM|nr:flavin reductase [Gilvimarinus sp. SDUM040013]MDO3388715.1 flavin reductase [Gilvimarinus sp. SDUM040013]MDX6849610.1 flavin reductase [Gilvimarinus sp. SDUM040013]